MCNEGRIAGARKVAGVWLLPKDAEKPADARIKLSKYINWRKKTDLSSGDKVSYTNVVEELKHKYMQEV